MATSEILSFSPMQRGAADDDKRNALAERLLACSNEESSFMERAGDYLQLPPVTVTFKVTRAHNPHHDYALDSNAAEPRGDDECNRRQLGHPHRGLNLALCAGSECLCVHGCGVMTAAEGNLLSSL